MSELPRFEHNQRKGAFRTWLRRVVANRLKSFHRSKANQPRGVGGADYSQHAERLADPQSDISRQWDEEHNRHVIHCLLKVVRPQFQDKTMAAFQKVVLKEQSAGKVAEDLGMTVNAVRIAHGRVLKAFRELGEGLLD